MVMDFKIQLNEKIENVISILKAYLPVPDGQNDLLIDAMAYSLFAGGKRIRPIFMVETFKLLNGEGDIIKPFMAAIEMIHTYSLIHDDLPAMDNDDLRRGMPTCHVKFGEDIAVLAGDALLNNAFEIMIKAALSNPDIRVIKAINELGTAAGTKGMIGGQVADVLNENKPIGLELLNYIHLHKTSALIEAAFVIGATLANATNEIIEIFRNIGKNIGLAFQIQDDLLDVLGNEEALGKPLHSDEKNNKITYVSLKGIEASNQIINEQLTQATASLQRFDQNKSGFLMYFIQYLKTRTS